MCKKEEKSSLSEVLRELLNLIEYIYDCDGLVQRLPAIKTQNYDQGTEVKSHPGISHQDNNKCIQDLSMIRLGWSDTVLQ